MTKTVARTVSLLLCLAATAGVPLAAQPDDFALLPELTAQAIFSCQDLKIAGNSVVSSEGRASGVLRGEEGHVRSNASIELDGSVEVHGDAIAGPGGQVILNGEPAQVTGEITSAGEPLDCRPIDLAALAAALEAANDNAAIPLTDKGREVLGGADGRAFELEGKDAVTLPPGTYLFSSLKLTGNSEIRTEGPVRVLVTGAVEIGGGGLFNANGNPFHLRLWSAGATLQVTSKAFVNGFLYAPDAEVLLAGQSELRGGVFAHRVDVVGGAKVKRLIDDAPPVVEINEPIDGAVVEVCEIPVRGRASDGETAVSLTVNGEPVALDADGNFDTVVSLFTDDPGLIVAVATDLAGNTAATQVRVEIVLPVVALTDPVPGSLIGTRVVTLSGTSGTALEVTVNGVPAVVAGGAFTLEGFDLGADGLKTLEIVGTNCGGSGTATPVLDLDTTPPVVTIDSPETGSLFGASPITVVGTVIDAHPAGVTVNGVAAAVNGERFVAEIALGEGSNTLIAVATDQLGLTASSTPVVVELDTTAPTVTIDTPTNGSVVATPAITVEGEVSDANLSEVTVNGVAATVEGLRFRAAGVPLVEGDNEITAEAVDQVGNEATPSTIIVVLDTLPPEVAIDADALPDLTAEAAVTVTGTVRDPHLDTVTVNGVEAIVNDETFVAEGVPLAEGPNELVATAVDTLFHSASSEPPVIVVRDSLPPEVAITEPASGDGFDTRTITVRGTVTDAHLDTVTVNGVPATVTGETFEATIEQPEGDSDIVARAVDVLGQAADSDPVTVTVDTLAPVVRLDVPADPLVGAQPITVTGTVEEPHLLDVTVAGLPATVDGETFSVDGVPLVEGSNPLTATARDTFGHTAVSDPVTWVLDTLPPELTIATPAEGAIVTSLAVTVAGTVADPHLDTVTVQGAAATVGDGTYSATVPLTDGVNTLVVVATDLLGHTAEISVNVLLDTLPPAVTIIEPAVAAGGCLAGGALYTLSGGFADPNPATGQDGQPPAVLLEVQPAGGIPASYVGTLAPDLLTWTVPGVDLGSADGIATATVTATDVIGNASRVVRSWRVDAGTPVVTITLDGAPFPAAAGDTPLAGAEPVLFGRRIAFAATVVDGAGGAPPPAVLTLNGAPYAAGTPITADGDYLLVATATDCAGHSATVHALVRVDLTGPTLISTEPADGAVLTSGIAAYSGTSDPDLASAKVNGQPAPVTDGAFSLAPYPWREGANAVTIELADEAGNRTVHARSFTVRSLPLTVEILESGRPLADGTVFLRPVKPVIRASDARATVAATLNGAPFTSSTEIAVSGDYALAATATDDLGRTANASVTFSIDLEPPPTIAITAPEDGTLVPGPTVDVSGTVTGSEPTVSVNGLPAVVTGGTWSVAGVPVEAGVGNDLVALVEDRAGRRAEAAIVVLVRGGPGVLILEPADGTVTNRRRIDVAGVVVGGARDTADGTVEVTGLTVPVAPDGAFRALDLPLAEGPNLLTARAVDRFGRPGEDSLTVHSDTTPPEIRFLADGQPLADGASFSRTITLGVEVSDSSGQVAAPIIRLNGDAQTAVAGLTEIPVTEEGGYVLSVVARDAAGNGARAERSFILDFGGCAISGVEPAAGSAVVGESVTLAGRSGLAASVAVRVPFPGGAVETYAATVADGTFLAGDVPLPVEGTNALEIVCTDGGGASQTEPHPIERLASGGGPAIDVQSPTDGALFASDTVAVSGTVSGGAATVNGLAAEVTPGTPQNTFQATGVPLVEGPNILAARVVDPLGRTASDRVVVDRDSQAPRLTITAPDNNTPVGIAGSGPAAIDVSGVVDLDTEPHLDGVVVSTAVGAVDAVVDAATGRFVAVGVPLDAAVAAGQPQTITATATDALGHAGTATVDVFLDATGPAIVLTAPEDLTLYTETSPPEIAITGEAWAGDGAGIDVNGGQLDPATLSWSAPAADGRRHTAFSATIGLPGSDGPFGVIARVSELDGRVAVARRLLQKDSVPPEVIEIVPADGTEGVSPNALLLVLFSEPILHASLAAADGLTLERLATGETVVGAVTVAGNAVGFAPGTALAVGESYRFRAGLGITDVAGHPLAAAAEATFRVADEATADAPVVDPLPAVLCADELVVTGTAASGAAVKVRDGNLVLSGFADAAGAFAVTVPVTSNGFHLLRVFTVDAASGATSPEAVVVVRVDCSAPTVTDAVFDRDAAVVTITFSEAVDAATLAVGAAGDAIVLSDAEDGAGTPQAGVLAVAAEVATVELDAAADAWWRDRPVRLKVGPPAADLEGNEMAAVFEVVFFPGTPGGDLAGGFLFGEAYDDAVGRPLEGVTAGLYSSAGALPGTGAAATAAAVAVSEGRGRYTMAGEVPAGRYAVVLEKQGYTRVVRRLALEPAIGTVPFDGRLTPLAAAAGVIDPAAGGRAAAAGAFLALEADVAALPGSEPLTVHLTALSGQGLPDFLPLGWTPAAAADVRLVAAGAPLPDGAAAPFAVAGVRLDLPLPAWVEAGDELYAARYDLAAGVWTALELERVSGPAGEPLARVSLVGPGAVAVVVPDADPATRPALPAAEGEVLQGVALPAEIPVLAADVTLAPPVVPPTGRSAARVVARAVDGATPWPSGLAVQAFLEEKLILAAGAGQLLEAPFAADLVLYHPRLTSEEQGTNAAASAGAMTFAVSPSPRAAQVLLDVGFENIRLYPFPEEVERGQIVGPAGGTVGSPVDVELVLPEGALAVPTAATVELLIGAELAALPPVDGYDTLAAVRVDLKGETLARAATVRLKAPAATPPEVPGEPRIIVAELIEEPADFRGSYARLAARAARTADGQGERIVAGPASDGQLPLEGIVREGVYLVLWAQAPIGYATGLVLAPNGAALEDSRVTADGLGTADLSALGGRYSVPVPAGADRVLRALHPFLDETGTALVSLAPDQVVALDLTIQPVPPEILSFSPVDGAVDQPVGTSPSVLFSEALDPASIGAATMTLELADASGAPSGLVARGAVTLAADGVRVIFTPERPLVPGRTYIARFAGGVRDAGGASYAGPAPVVWRFSTSTVVAPGGQVDPSKFHIRLPADGVAEIFADPGAIPTVLAGETPWAVSPEVDRSTDPVRDTYLAEPDGSFSGTVGHPPSHPVTLADKVYVKVFDPNGQLAAHFQVGPFVTADGNGFVASPGEELIFVSADGIVVEVPAGAFDQATLVTVKNRPLTDFTGAVPEGMALGAFTDVDFEGEANETLRLSVPAPAAVPDDAQVFVASEVDMPWGRRLQLISVGGVLIDGGERFLSNDPSLQPELPPPGTGGLLTTPTKADEPATCAEVKERGLSRCLIQDLLFEFSIRRTAAWFYEFGAQMNLITGPFTSFAASVGVSQEAFYNQLADSLVYLPRPMDSRGGFWILPTVVDEPFTMVRRDTATGWILTEQAYDPVADSARGLVQVDLLAGGEPRVPMLIDARPFQLLRFAAPDPDQLTLVRLEVEAEADANRHVTLRAAADFPLPDATTLAVFDLSPLVPAGPDAESAAPVEGPVVQVCDNGASWASTPFEGTDDMLLVMAPGDLDAARLDTFEFQFDQALDDISERPTEEVVVLEDLGPADGCSSSGAAGFRDVPLELELVDRGSRLVVTPQGTLPAGHRFRLELMPQALTLNDGTGAGPSYWASAPRSFEFATREVPGEVLGTVDPATFPFGATSVRDVLHFGNLLLAATDGGQIVAVDLTAVDAEGQLRPHAVKNGFNGMIRSLGTDGHNRLFYAGLFGMVWAMKAVTIEDARAAAAECVDPADWAAGLPCFNGVTGSARIAYWGGAFTGLSGSEYLAAGAMPTGSPKELKVLTRDETGSTLELSQFVETYAGTSLADLTPDAEGIYTFDVELTSTYQRAASGQLEPSLDPATAPTPPVPDFRQKVCEGEEDYDRYQRATIDNLTTGQSWSIDVQNPWPSADDGGGNGTATVTGLRARRGDELRVRYNVRALGYVAVLGSGISVVDLNRFYRLPGGAAPLQRSAQCGRRLGKFEGATIDFPSCAIFGSGPEGISMTAAVTAHGDTGCDDAGENCRGFDRLDVYSPLIRVGLTHTESETTDPGKLKLNELTACIKEVKGEFAWLFDVELADEVTWVDRKIRVDLAGGVSELGGEPEEKEGDLLFLSLGAGGIFVFDVSERQANAGTLVGHLKAEGHSAFRLQLDRARGLLFAGGTDYTGASPQPVIDVWDVRFVGGAPGASYEPQPRVSVHAPWNTRHLGIDQSGTGLLYTWDQQLGPRAVPFDSPRFSFSGLYLPEDEPLPQPGDERPSAVQRATRRFVPLGVPMATTLAAEAAERAANERTGTAAFKLRIALPGSLGEELTAKVQSLRALPDERFLGQDDVGAAVALPGGPGWPGTEVFVTLRRVGSGTDEGAPANLADGESGRFATVYNLYESAETVLLLADPRARRGYRLQDVPDGEAAGSESADEKAQCRRCAWPPYLPDPKSPEGQNDPALDDVEELLAGRYVRAFLAVDADGSEATRLRTEQAIEFFDRQGANYRLPAGYATVAAPADAVPSPLQVSLAEPARNPALWSLGEAGAAVSLTGGEALLTQIDHAVAGRGVPFSLARAYRSGYLGYGPLGSAGWSANVFAHLTEVATTGEVGFYDGAGQVWRFFPRGGDDPPAEWDDDVSGSYHAPAGLYLRLQKLAAGQGWRLYDRNHHSMRFDEMGRLVEVSDRHRRNFPADEQGNTITYRYDAFGQLVAMEDDLGREYAFEYLDDPRPAGAGGDGPLYGLLAKITDFVGREIEYVWGDDRTLLEVKLPEVTTTADGYGDFAHQGDGRPTLMYFYDPADGVTAAEDDTVAVLHGEYAKLRLGSFHLPEFGETFSGVPRLRLAYNAATGRLASLSVPDRDNQNSATGGVTWVLDYPQADAAPATEVTVREPWGHELGYTLADGRVERISESLEVVRPGDDSFTQETVERTFTYTGDGRLESLTQPDGGQRSHCYPDGEGGPGCPGGGGGGQVDRLRLANVEFAVTAATSQAGQGSASYGSVETRAEYQEDNLASRALDGLRRPIQLAVPVAGKDGRVFFEHENVGGRFEYDNYGRVKRYEGGTAADPVANMSFHPDHDGRESAGLLATIEYGDSAAVSESFEYDEAFNVEERVTSYGTRETAEYDEWDRAVRIESGLVTDSPPLSPFSPVGNAECGEAAEGAVVERAFDAAGHVVRERRLQDYVSADGSIQCRFVETSYHYNAREQLIEVRHSHLASPTQPGAVDPLTQPMVELSYDPFGRLEQKVRLNKVDDQHLITTYRYDAAGRVAGVTVGEAGEQVTGYDENSRVALTTDGDEGVWRQRWDVWDRVYHEKHPTGAFVLRQFDKAHNLVRETTFAADPLAGGAAPVLADVGSRFTSFGQVDRVVTVLTDAAGGSELRVVVREFDEAGRVTGVFSGPAAGDTELLDETQAQREMEVQYEIDVGRVLVESYGGELQDENGDRGPALYAHRYSYLVENRTPWPDAVDYLEAVPGGGNTLVDTFTTEFTRDAFGRPLVESHSDGRKLTRIWDRSRNDVISLLTGADTETRLGFDGRGLQVRYIRPDGRGETTYAYDQDGRLMRSSATTAAGNPWDTVYTYDSTGRVTRILHEDTTFEDIVAYNPDNTPAQRLTREGITLTYAYDAANRLLSTVPSAAALPASLVPLDAGDFFSYDELSRITEAGRGSPGGAAADPALAVAYTSYDLASRPAAEVVGDRAPLAWTYDTWNRPTEVQLPDVVARDPAGAFLGFTRQYDTLDRLFDVGGLGGDVSLTPLGVAWDWGGRDRMYGCTTKGALGTAARYGYIAGPGAQPSSPGQGGDSRWRLGTLTWGVDPDEPSGKVWGRFGFGWRGSDGSRKDGVKTGREATSPADGLDLFAGMGWSWTYDAGVRLQNAVAGRGDLEGDAAPSSGLSFTFDYGEGDELRRLIRDFSGETVELTHGEDGRVASRNGELFAYDNVGRRTADDRFVYRWSWRGELMSVTVKDTWPDGVVSPFAGHQVRYEYDAFGRLTFRWHVGQLPSPGADDSLRPFIEKRAYVWEGQGLLAEVGYNDPEGTQIRWRKTYVPGYQGLDDAVQVAVDVVNMPGWPVQGERLYTYVRDELGSVIALVAEDEPGTPDAPPIPVRYLYTPYGEVHVEASPELLRARFDNGTTSVETAAGTVEQTVADPSTHAGGVLELRFSAPIADASLAAGLPVERLETVGGWTAVDTAEVVIGRPVSDGVSGGSGSEVKDEIAVLLRSGWDRGRSYRVRVTPSLLDTAGRPFDDTESLEWSVPVEDSGPVVNPPVIFERQSAVEYESFKAAAETVGGRFPGGQTHLFQGLWTDPVTGIYHARARWYDARSASWLSEDPLQDVDSTNLYAFVGWQPHMGVDPLGLQQANPVPTPRPAPSPTHWRYTARLLSGGAAAGAASTPFWTASVSTLPAVAVLPLVAISGGVGYGLGWTAGRYYEPVAGFTLNEIMQMTFLSMMGIESDYGEIIIYPGPPNVLISEGWLPIWSTDGRLLRLIPPLETSGATYLREHRSRSTGKSFDSILVMPPAIAAHILRRGNYEGGSTQWAYAIHQHHIYPIWLGGGLSGPTMGVRGVEHISFLEPELFEFIQERIPAITRRSGTHVSRLIERGVVSQEEITEALVDFYMSRYPGLDEEQVRNTLKQGLAARAREEEGAQGNEGQ